MDTPSSQTQQTQQQHHHRYPNNKKLKLTKLEQEHHESYGQLVPGRLEELKQREAELASQLAAIRREKLSALRSRPLTIGIVGFGRFGQFIAQTFVKHAKVVATSRSDYTELAQGLGVTYVPWNQPDDFVANLDVIVFAVSILSFRSTVENFAPILKRDLERRRAQEADGSPVAGPLIVDVLSVKEHARTILLDLLPPECDVLCTHPMFGPDSGKNGWKNLNFVYEKTRIDQVVEDHDSKDDEGRLIAEDRQSYIEGMDRMERFLSIWEEEGCRMVPMSCKEHDEHAANSQFITHLVGRVLGSQGLVETPIDTSGFQSVLKLVGSTTADSFDLFYGLYKYNDNSLDTITNLQEAMNQVVSRLQDKELEEQQRNQQNNAKLVVNASADATCEESSSADKKRKEAA